MRSIVHSAYTVGHPQRDGRCYVVERHTDDAGAVHEIEYLAPSKVDHAAIARARAAELSAQLAADAVRVDERAAAQAKLQDVLAAAVQSGDISEVELRKVGMDMREPVYGVVVKDG